MRVQFNEPDYWKSIDPARIETYLSFNRWRLLERKEGKVSIWDNHDSSGNVSRVWVPLDTKLGDYRESIGRVFEVVSSFEERGIISIFEDLDTIVFGDILRFFSEDPLSRLSGTLPVQDGLLLLKKARDIVISGACSVVEPKRVLPFRKPVIVEDYIQKVRIGQTERGSYIIKLISPLPDLPHQMPLRGFTLPEPFERKAVRKTMEALDTVKELAAESLRKGSFDVQPFYDATDHGITANLCDALVRTVDESYSELEVSVTWAFTELYEQVKPIDIVVIPTEIMPIIKEAGKLLREIEPQEVSLYGYVTKLHRERGLGSGKITLVTLFDRRERRVMIELSESDYEMAIEAHRDGLKVRCSGQLIKEGRWYKLNDPIGFSHVVED